MAALRFTLRLYFYQAWFSYRALFAWNTPFNYLASKFGFPFFTMLLFVFMGKFVGLTDPVYIVIGNILMLPANNGIYGISMTVANEKIFGALSYLLGSPAPRGPIFLGRSLFHILDGFTTVLVALPVAILIFHLDLSHTNFALVLLCLVIIAITTCGVGLIVGSISLVTREGWMITTTIGQLFYILAGVNVPVDVLPGFLRIISYGLPLTRGIQATRLALAGTNGSSIGGLLVGEILVGAIYIFLGFQLFRILERRSLVSGFLDAL